jgi:hypothetical protein
MAFAPLPSQPVFVTFPPLPESATLEQQTASLPREPSMDWSQDMDITLLQCVKTAEKAEVVWATVAQEVQKVSAWKVTEDACLAEYHLIRQKAWCYETVFADKAPEVNESFPTKMDWTDSKCKTLVRVIEKWRAVYAKKESYKGLWKNVTDELNKRFQVNFQKKQYQDKYRSLSYNKEPLSPEEKGQLIEALKTNKYYKFSPRDVFEGVNYAEIAKFMDGRNPNMIFSFFQTEASIDIYLKEVQAMENERRQGAEISSDTFYLRLGLFNLQDWE